MRLAAAAAVYQHWFGPRTRYKIYEISRAKKQFRLAAAALKAAAAAPI